MTTSTLLVVSLFMSANAEPPETEGLVLWLDATDAATIGRGVDGRVSQWRDKSPCGNVAAQESEDAQPTYVVDSIGHQPALRFQGGQFMNLGQPESLDFATGSAQTVLVVCNVSGGNSGTLIAKGGGAAGERALQLYAAPGRLGTVAHGVMQEHHETPQPKIAALVCELTRVKVFSNGQQVMSFAAGTASSHVDVLVGARRKNADNTGIYYPLTGDIAEMLIYDRALDGSELAELTKYLARKYELAVGEMSVADLRLLRAGNAVSDAQLDALADIIADADVGAGQELRSLVRCSPDAALGAAELLMHVASKNRLSEPLAVLAADLLDHDDPFVRGLAEWAITMKVGHENNGQEAKWPVANPPGWFATWIARTPQQLIEADWVRQAVSRGIHRDSERLAASVDQMMERGERMRAHYAATAPDSAPCRHMDRSLRDLVSLRNQLAGMVKNSPGNGLETRRLWVQARRVMRDLAFAQPAVDFPRLLFVKRFAPHTVRNITRSYAWKHKPGGDLCILDDVRTGQSARNLIAGRLGPGFVWGVDLWWDAKRVVFGFARQPHWPPDVDTADSRIEGTNVFRLRQRHPPLHLFEAGVDGGDLVQLTDDPYWSDFEPTYCANGDVVFASDRCGRSAECGNDTYDHTNPNLYVWSRTNGSIRLLTDSKDLDRYPHSLGDGRIAYTHWEYQERHFLEVHSIWTIRPDGTMSDALYKQHLRAPYGLRDTRSIPQSQKLVAVATGHHTFAYGPIVVIDPRLGPNSEAGMAILTPGVQPQEGPMAGRPVAEGGVPDRGGLYQTPWALDETCFLAAYAYDRPHCTAPAGVDSNGFAIYLVDVFGNRELIQRDLLLSCTFPMPLRPRVRPPILSPQSQRASPEATCYVSDVYDGMRDVPRGTIKYIRISQHVGWPFNPHSGQMDYIPGNASAKRIDFPSWSPVRVIGTVPVERDGSAHFVVPADTAVYFQALDKNQMEVVRMRSFVSLRPGEVRGCRGCHESQGHAPAARALITMAGRRPPSRPVPPPWGGQRLVGYEWLIQPILEQRCVRCHGRQEPAGGLDFTAMRAGDGLMQSYRTMFGLLPGDTRRGETLVARSDRFSNADVTRPWQFGSHQSPLVQVLLDDALHLREVRLTPTQWQSLVTWVDANAPYHDAFRNKRPSTER